MDKVNGVVPDAESSQAETAPSSTSRRFTMPSTGRRKPRADGAEVARRGTPRNPRRPASSLAERWTRVDGVDVFYRESPQPPDAPVMLHLHGFGLSGRYLLPIAERLADEFHTLVPDLPGFGRSGRPVDPLDVPDLAHAAARFLDDRQVKSATLVGNSMGCPLSANSRTTIRNGWTGRCSSHRQAACTTSQCRARSNS